MPGTLHRTLRATRRALFTLALAGAALGTAGSALAQQVLLAVDTRVNRVMLLDPFDGAILNAALIPDTNAAGTYDMQTPRAAIQVGSEIWVSDQGPNTNAIFRFDLAGQHLGTIGGAAGGLSNVRGLRLIDGVVHAVNVGTANNAPGPAIVRIATDGTILGSFSTVAAGGAVGASPWDITWYDGRYLVSDGTSRGLQQYNADGSYFGAFTPAQINNIPQQMFVRANGNVLMSANGSQPLGSFGLYELSPAGAIVAQWTGTPGLGVRGVYELGNGRYLISEGGGGSAVRGLGTIDPAGPASNTNFELIQGFVNGGWVSVAVIPEPGTWALMAGGLLVVGGLVRRRAAQA